MLITLSRQLQLALLGLFLAVPTVQGQGYPNTVGAQSAANFNRAAVNPNYYVAPGVTVGQAAYNTAVLGNAARNLPPSVNNVNVNAAAFGGYGYAPYYSTPAEGYLRGAADLTAATGQYWQDIQQARIAREQSRQAHIETQRKQVQWELEYERMQPTAATLQRDLDRIDINHARSAPSTFEISSGSTLNVLYKSILNSPRPIEGPLLPLEEQVRRGINLSTSATNSAGLGLLKDAGRLPWPFPLQDPLYDEARKAVDKTIEAISRSMSSGGPQRDDILKLKDATETLSSLVDGQVKELSPSDFVASRRFLTQLKQTTKALTDPTLMRSAAAAPVPPTVRTLTDLIIYMRNNGLSFAPAAAAEDGTAYSTLYYEMRIYEQAVAYTGSRLETPPR
jgi:hypothetical protein